jgi:hypothetical protein
MHQIPFRLLSTVLAACLLPTFVSAEIVYKVAPSIAGDHLSIEIDFDVSAPTVELQMPSWLLARNYFRFARDTGSMRFVNQIKVGERTSHPAFSQSR